VDHQVQQFFYFGLELHFLNSHGSPRRIQNITFDTEDTQRSYDNGG
jgi:hypothetical protein